jgi:hypothetical protein
MPSASATTIDEFPNIAKHLYARWTLDCLAEIGYAISKDAIARPQLYQSDDIPDELVTLRMSYGTAPHFPNSAQRRTMMSPILGSSDGLRTAASSQFQTARRNFVDACVVIAENASAAEGRILEERVRSSAAILRAHLEGVRGKSFRLSMQQINALFEIAVRTLKTPGVTKVFGIEHIQPEWPFNSMDPNGAKLIENIGTALSLSGDCKLTFTDFLSLQWIAQEGSQVIHLLLSVDPLSDNDLKSLIRSGYSWGTSLREVAGGSQYVPQAVARPPINPRRAIATVPQPQANPLHATTTVAQPPINPRRAITAVPQPQATTTVARPPINPRGPPRF